MGLISLTTVWVVSIFFMKFSQLTMAQISILSRIMFLPVVSIIGLLVTGYGLVRTKIRNEFRDVLIIGFLLSLVVGTVSLRMLVTGVSQIALPQSIGLSLVYTVMGMIASIVIAMDLSKKIQAPIDTVTDEDPRESPIGISGKWKLVFGLGLMIIVGTFIATTKTSIIQAPIFGVTDVLFNEAVVSGLVGGVIETAFFFAVLMPTIYAFVNKTLNNSVIASIMAIVGISVIFLLFHTTVYQYDAVALNTVLIFGFMNAMVVFVIRDNWINTMIHGTNNFMIVIISIQKITFAIAGF